MAEDGFGSTGSSCVVSRGAGLFPLAMAGSRRAHSQGNFTCTVLGTFWERVGMWFLLEFYSSN